MKQSTITTPRTTTTKPVSNGEDLDLNLFLLVMQISILANHLNEAGKMSDKIEKTLVEITDLFQSIPESIKPHVKNVVHAHFALKKLRSNKEFEDAAVKQNQSVEVLRKLINYDKLSKDLSTNINHKKDVK